jgi:endonuclease/exonuclease/phosphatase family metal-dependent hydrolase
LISRIVVRLRWLRSKLNRTYWAARILGIHSPAGEADLPGLIMIQIDGLSRTQMERALESGKLPFLARLIRQGHFTLESFYSGVPSTTPAVQGEIFFGVKKSVPAFEYLHRETGEVFRMNEAHAAEVVETALDESCAEPLLKDGCSYSNIYRSSAGFSRYCSQDLAPEKFFGRMSLLKGLVLVVAYAPKILRMAGLTVLEFGLAVVDMLKGLFEREHFLNELAFVPARVLVCILLREMIRFRVLLDIESGVQVIHANFLGYDEQAHRRGPDSAFAHWTLKGIDRAVRDICQAASHSVYRDYEWIIYSDHGQERTIPYERKHGRGVATALREVFSRGPLADSEIWVSSLPKIVGDTLSRCRRFFRISSGSANPNNAPDPATMIVFTALGPLGHLYLPRKPTLDDMDAYARDFVAKAAVPLVLLPRSDGTVSAFNRRGEWRLPDDRAEVLGTEHPALDECAKDLVQLCAHRDAGDFVLSGWDPQQEPLSFSMENGGHGGPGFEETRGFLLVPDRIRRWHVTHLRKTEQRVRGEELRKIALHFLGRDGPREERAPHHVPRGEDVPIRVMTYNIHSCIGIDGKVRPERVARVINHCDPDIVAVQEIDVHRARSGRHHQAELIAAHLRMEHEFHALLEEERERYGIAIFARHPFEVVRSARFPQPFKGLFYEQRGAIWIRMKFGGRDLHLINTHLGLGRGERHSQVEHLMGDQWLGSIPENEPVILCGDFNSRPRSRVISRLSERLSDVQLAAKGHKPRATFSSVQPLVRIDHVFVSRHFNVENVEVPSTPTALIASDHLPICVQLKFDSHYEVA